MSRLTIGAAITVVASAISTIIAKVRSESTPRLWPIERITNSVRPRVFISAPRITDSRRRGTRESRREAAADELARRRHGDNEDEPAEQRRAVRREEIRAQAGDGEEDRQEDDHREVLYLVRQFLGHAGALRHDRAEEERAEDRVDADALCAKAESSTPPRTIAT